MNGRSRGQSYMIMNLGEINWALKNMKDGNLHNWQTQRGGHLELQLGPERHNLRGFTDPEVEDFVQYSDRVMRNEETPKNPINYQPDRCCKGKGLFEEPALLQRLLDTEITSIWEIYT